MEEMARANASTKEAVQYAGQVWTESAGNANARSRFAAGLAQFTPPTWRDISPKTDPSCEGIPAIDPNCSVRAQVVYMRILRRPFKFLGDEQWLFAQVSYNGGLGWTKRERRLCAALPWCNPNKWWKHVEKTCHPKRAGWACKENREYPRRIRRWTRRLEKDI